MEAAERTRDKISGMQKTTIGAQCRDNLFFTLLIIPTTNRQWAYHGLEPPNMAYAML